MDVGFTNALAAGLVLGVMIIPTIASLSEDAMSAVPQSLRQGSLAMGANRMQTTLRVVFPAALSGVAAAVVLGLSRAVGETMIVALAAGARTNLYVRPARGHADDDRVHRATAGGENPVGSSRLQHALRRRPAAVRDHLIINASASPWSVASGRSTDGRHPRLHPHGAAVRPCPTGRSPTQHCVAGLPGAAVVSLFFGVMVLLVADHRHRHRRRTPASTPTLITRYDSTLFPERTGFRAGILGTLWLMVPPPSWRSPRHRRRPVSRGVRRQNRWYNRLIELNLQNLAAVPSIVYGLLAVAVMALIGFERKASCSAARSRWPC